MRNTRGKIEQMNVTDRIEFDDGLAEKNIFATISSGTTIDAADGQIDGDPATLGIDMPAGKSLSGEVAS
jgi:hypothetical protein